jgi:hypothetical protein
MCLNHLTFVLEIDWALICYIYGNVSGRMIPFFFFWFVLFCFVILVATTNTKKSHFGIAELVVWT